MKNTFCVFHEHDTNVLKELNLDYKSNSGSQYFYTESGVFRLSDHWGRTANSKWRLLPINSNVKKIKLGYAYWSDFHKDSLTEKIYFIEVNFEKNEVFFNHKNNQSISSKAILRTASETTKTIRQIRNLLKSNSWTNYFDDENIKKKIVDALINSEKSLLDIKKSFLNNL